MTRDEIWGRIYAQINLWMERAKLTDIQREVYMRGWDVRPLTTLTDWMTRRLLTVIEAGAPRGREDNRIAELMSAASEDELADDTPLGADAHISYYLEMGERRTPVQRTMSAIGSIRTPKKAAASRENGKKGGRPRKSHPEK